MNSCTVQDKIPCIFETSVVPDMPSQKHVGQLYRVTADAEHVRPEAARLLGTHSCIATEKLDGTCAKIQSFEGRPWLWARHDRRPTKLAEKRFREFRRCDAAAEGDVFEWEISKDFKEVPAHWIPAGRGQPDAGGHIPGWVPVDTKAKMHCWHLATVDLESTGLALILRPSTASLSSGLEIVLQPLAELDGCTVELIGTNVNANPYHIGSRQHPIHFLVQHGSIQFTDPLPPPGELLEWFSNSDEGNCEGIVWHCDNGDMFKLHRHHIDLPWPIQQPHLASLSVSINLQNSMSSENVTGRSENKLHQAFQKLSGYTFDSLCDIQLEKC